MNELQINDWVIWSLLTHVQLGIIGFFSFI